MRSTDHEGNSVIADENGIYLVLAKDRKPKRIFSIEYGALTKRVGKKGLMRNTVCGPMVGFNYEALKMLSRNIKEIVVYAEGIPHKVKVKDILERKDFLWFKTQGYEKQLFYPVECMEELKK